VLLTGRDSIPAVTLDELRRLRPQRLVVLGGPAAVATTVEQRLRTVLGADVVRLAGGDRFATAARVSAAAFPAGVPVVYLAGGGGYADAVAAGPAAGHRGGPVLLTARDTLPAATADELRRLRPGAIVVLGGPAVVGATVEQQLRAFTTEAVTRQTGADRFSTSTAVSADAFTPDVPIAFLATGWGFADALAVGPAAALAPGPVLLASSDCIPAAVAAELDRLRPDRIVLLGGEHALGPGVAAGRIC
jgi:putative cell wall-binding protein